MKAIFNFLLNLSGIILEILGDSLTALFDSLTKPKGHNACFGKETMIASRWNKGFLISKHRRMSRKLSFQNLLICSQTGGGKTSKLIIKNLLLMRNCSCIINDPSGELFQNVSGYLSEFFTIKTLNFSNELVSSGYNYLAQVKKHSDVNKLAYLLATGLDKGSGSDPFWITASQDALSIAIRIVLHQSEEYRHMANVRQVLLLLMADPKKVDQMVVSSKDEKLLLDYKSLIGTNAKTLQSILATAKACLQAWDDDTVAKITAHHSIDFTELRQKPTLLFLHNDIGSQRYVGGLTGMFFEQLFGYLLAKLPDKKELDLFIVLEECSSLYIPLLPLFLANARKCRIGTLLCLQTLSGQLKKFYGDDARNIITNAVTKIFLAGQTEIDVLKELETLGGKTTYLDDRKVRHTKPLIEIHEIRLLKENRSLIVSGNKPLIMGRVSPYYKSRKYKSLVSIPPLSLAGDIPEEPIALIR